MPKVIDLETARVRRLSFEIERELRQSGSGSVSVPVDAVDDVGRWRRAAIQAAHRCGERATTIILGDQVVLEVDRPVTLAESRAAAAVMSRLLGH